VANCPSCGRYAEPAESCPFCGARFRGRVSLRALKAAALVFAILGSAGLWLIASRAEPPLIALGDSSHVLNGAAVRLHGRCVRGSSYNQDKRMLGFWLDDGSGEAYCWRPVSLVVIRGIRAE
jgi:hypothetical protein